MGITTDKLQNTHIYIFNTVYYFCKLLKLKQYVRV